MNGKSINELVSETTNKSIEEIAILRSKLMIAMDALYGIKKSLGSIGDEDGYAGIWHFEKACGDSRDAAMIAIKKIEEIKLYNPASNGESE